jgi:hypothetical protein
MPDQLFKNLTNPKSKDYSGMRTRTKELSKTRLKLYAQGRLGVIIDGTGHKFKDVKKERQKLITMGYDTYMVFVNTSLDVAQKRNLERDRILPSEVVEKYWNEVQKNMAYFQGLFGGSNFLLVDNNATLSPKQAQKKFNMLVTKGIGKFIKKPIKSKVAKKWIQKQQILKKSGIKEIEVPSPSRENVKKNKTNSMSGYEQIKEFINKPKMKKALQQLVDKNLIPKNYAKNMSKLQHFLTNNPMVMTQLLRLLGENINEAKREIRGYYLMKQLKDLAYDAKRNRERDVYKALMYLYSRINQSYRDEDLNARDVQDIFNDPRGRKYWKNLPDWMIDSLFEGKIEEAKEIKKVVGISSG